MLFPVPTKPLAIGQTDEVPFSMPMRGIAPTNVASAPLVLTYVRDTPRCAELAGKIRIDQVGDVNLGKFSLDGTYCLDRSDASVVSARLTVEMEIGPKAPDAPGRMKLAATIALDRK